MPRTCTICNHQQVEAINTEIVNGVSLRNIAQQFNVNYSAVNRHKKSCLPADMVKAKEVGRIAQAESLLDQLQSLQGRTLNVLQAAENTKDFNTALRAISEARRNIELLAKVTGKLTQKATVSVQVLIPVLVEIISGEIQDPVVLERIADQLEELENNGLKGMVNQ